MGCEDEQGFFAKMKCKAKEKYGEYQTERAEEKKLKSELAVQEKKEMQKILADEKIARKQARIEQIKAQSKAKIQRFKDAPKIKAERRKKALKFIQQTGQTLQKAAMQQNQAKRTRKQTNKSPLNAFGNQSGFSFGGNTSDILGGLSGNSSLTSKKKKSRKKAFNPMNFI